MANVRMAKGELRHEFKRVRQELGSRRREAIDRRIGRNVLGCASWAAAPTVYAYLSFGAEISTRALVRAAWEQGKVVAAPRCVPETRRMDWYRIDSYDGLEHGPFGILEPPRDLSRRLPAEGTPDAVALVPGLAFDPKGFRLGYGGGYYDNFLVRFRGTSVGLCRQAQLSRVPLVREPHDLPVQIVMTEHSCP